MNGDIVEKQSFFRSHSFTKENKRKGAENV